MDYDAKKQLIKLVQDDCKLKGLSPRTIQTYSSIIGQYIDYLQKNNTIICCESVKDYLLSRKLANNSMRLHRAALSNLLRLIGVKVSFDKLPIAKKKYSLPKVIDKKDIKLMIEKTTNVKHRLVIQLLYSCGLRLEELQNLKRENIDCEKGIVTVVGGKGKKDRLTIISKTLMTDLLMYYSTTNFTTPYVFEGRSKKYSKKSIQKIVELAGKRINKKVTPHMLRHSFATHLLESGVSVRHIQHLLGHASLNTTQVYTKIAKNQLEQIINPIDLL